MEGYRILLCWRTEEQDRDSELCLARRPGWGGGSLRAFRRAEVIVDAVLFESCVGGVAFAMSLHRYSILSFGFSA